LATGQPPDAGLTYRYFDVAAKHLRVGKNILAVEIHRSHPAQGDLRFDLTLSTKQEKRPVSNRDREGREVARVRVPTLRDPVSIVTDPPGNLTGDVSRRFLDILEASVKRKDGRYVFSVVTAEAFPKPDEMKEGQCLDVIWFVDVDCDRSTGQSDLGNDYNIHLFLDKGGWQPRFYRVSPVAERDQVDVRNEDFIIDVRGREVSLSFPVSYLQRNTFDWWVVSTTRNAPAWPPLTENPDMQRATFDEHSTSLKPTSAPADNPVAPNLPAGAPPPAITPYDPAKGK
jgi:hypothetical protein